MQTRFSWLLALTLISILPFAGCNDDDNEFSFNGSNPILKTFSIGTVPIQNGATVNVPLASTNIMRFELSKPVSRASLTTNFAFSIYIENVDTGSTYVLTEDNLEENGSLFWADSSNTMIEYRLSRTMDKLRVGGQTHTIASPGQTLRVNVVLMVGLAQDGTQFAFVDDTFYIVYTSSNQTL